MTVSCADHEGTIQAASRPGKITSVWYVSDDSVIDPMVREAAANFAGEKKIATGCLLNALIPRTLVCSGAARPQQRCEPSTSARSGLRFLPGVPLWAGWAYLGDQLVRQLRPLLPQLLPASRRR
jgi:hypothetical protein